MSFDSQKIVEGQRVVRNEKGKHLGENNSIYKVGIVSKKLIAQTLENAGELETSQINSVLACISSLDFLQNDTLDELTGLVVFEDVRNKITNTKIDPLDRVNSLFGSPRIELQGFVDNRKVLFILLSNTFNRVDELGEIAIAKNVRNDGQAIGAEFMNNMLTKVRIASYKDASGEEKRANFFEMIHHIQNLAEIWKIDTSGWEDNISSIVRAQAIGMSHVANSRTSGQIAYTPEQGVAYRVNTVGNYASLLADAGYADDLPAKTRFIKCMMLTQAFDDAVDVFDDYDVQTNPFVAIVAKHNLFGEFKRYVTENKISKQKLKRTGYTAFAMTLNREISKQFTIDVNKAYEGYQKLTMES